LSHGRSSSFSETVASARARAVAKQTGERLTYFIQAGENGPIKIGSSNDPFRRLRTLQTGNDRPLVMLLAASGDFERKLHQKFAHLQLANEWFRPGADLIGFINYHRSLPEFVEVDR
jgi:hypothetical protein